MDTTFEHNPSRSDSEESSSDEDGDWFSRLGGAPYSDEDGDDVDGTGENGDKSERTFSSLFDETEAQKSRRLLAVAKRERSNKNRALLRQIPEFGIHLPDSKTTIVIDEVVGEQNKMLWDCAGILARFLTQKVELVKGQRVVELGCALGLPGIVAAALGAQEVILSERPSAMEWIRHQIELNSAHIDTAHVEAASIEWDRTLSPEIAKRCPFSTILCSDLIYAGDASTTRALVATIANLTQASSYAVVVSCYEVRDVPASQDEIAQTSVNDSENHVADTVNSSRVQEQLFSSLLASEAGFTKEEAIPFASLCEGYRDEDIIIKIHTKLAAQKKE